MRKGLVIISIFLITILLVGLVSCAKPETENPGEEDVVYYEDQPYTFNYQEGLADCRMELDGEGHVAVYKKYSYEKPVSESQELSASYMGAYRELYVHREENGFDFSRAYMFKKDGTLAYAADELYDQSYNYLEAVATDKVFSMTYSIKHEGMDALMTLSIKPLRYQAGQGYFLLGYSINVPEFKKAEGEYTIINGKFVKLNLTYASDYPTSVLNSYQVLPETTEGYGTRLLEESSGRKNGHVEITIQGSNRRYVQLKDDGTFYFVIASTTSSEEDLYTQDSYYGKTFTTKMSALSNGEGYSFEYELSFDVNGVATYRCTKCTMSKNYKVDSEGNLALLYYDIDEYNKLIGTHMDFGTSNNISFANNYIVYVDYNYSRYTFEGDTNITLYRFDDYVYAKLKNEQGVVISVKFYDDGKFEWQTGEFIGVDLSDHSEDF